MTGLVRTSIPAVTLLHTSTGPTYSDNSQWPKANLIGINGSELLDYHVKINLLRFAIRTPTTVISAEDFEAESALPDTKEILSPIKWVKIKLEQDPQKISRMQEKIDRMAQEISEIQEAIKNFELEKAALWEPACAILHLFIECQVASQEWVQQIIYLDENDFKRFKSEWIKRARQSVEDLQAKLKSLTEELNKEKIDQQISSISNAVIAEYTPQSANILFFTNLPALTPIKTLFENLLTIRPAPTIALVKV